MTKLLQKWWNKRIENNLKKKSSYGRGLFEVRLCSFFISLALRKPMFFFCESLGMPKGIYIIWAALIGCVIVCVVNHLKFNELSKSNYVATFIINLLCLGLWSIAIDTLLVAELQGIILEVLLGIFLSIISWSNDSFFKLTDKLGLNWNFKSKKLYMGAEARSIESSSRKLNLNILELNKKGKEGTSEIGGLSNSKDSDSSSVSSGGSSSSSESRDSISERVNKTVDKIVEMFSKIKEHTADALKMGRNIESGNSTSLTGERAGTPEKAPSPVPSSSPERAGTPERAASPVPSRARTPLPSSYWDRGEFSWEEFINSTEGKVAYRRLLNLEKNYSSFTEEYEKNLQVIMKIINTTEGGNIPSRSRKLMELDLQLREHQAKFYDAHKFFCEDYPRKPAYTVNHLYIGFKYKMDLWMWYYYKEVGIVREYLDIFEKDLRENKTREEYEEKFSRLMTQLRSNLDKHSNKHNTDTSLILKELEKLKISNKA